MTTRTQSLTDKQLTTLRDQLENALERAMRSAGIGAALVDEVVEELGPRGAGGVEALEALEDTRVFASLQERHTDRIREILEALKRMDHGTYGQCTGCDRTIAYVRLDVIPEATACMECASTAV